MRRGKTKAKPIPPRSKLETILAYDPATGLLRWVGSKRAAFNGKIAGSINGAGYVEVGTPFGRFLGHRLAWVFIKGKISVNQEIDHRDLDGSNNRENNLRDASHSENVINCDRPLPMSGLRGACFDDAHSTKKWRAQIRVNKKSLFLGRFDTAAEASAAYITAAKKYHGEFFRP